MKPAEPVKIELNQLSIATDFFGTNWNLSFQNADNYATSVTDVKVNGESWENSSLNHLPVVNTIKIPIIMFWFSPQKISVQILKSLF